MEENTEFATENGQMIIDTETIVPENSYVDTPGKFIEDAEFVIEDKKVEDSEVKTVETKNSEEKKVEKPKTKEEIEFDEKIQKLAKTVNYLIKNKMDYWLERLSKTRSLSAKLDICNKIRIE